MQLSMPICCISPDATPDYQEDFMWDIKKLLKVVITCNTKMGH